MKYIVTIEEMISQDFEVEANDMETALEIAEQNYRDGIFVLEPGNLVCKQISAESIDKTDIVDLI
ncbi:MAG: DpnD/PcfM family protein [Clostridiales bacterium]|nr:DpnD/PcfM family protein [Clostridiales bacterium]